MRHLARLVATVAFLAWSASGCQTGMTAGNEGGSQPINEGEATDYKKALVRCYKTGGTRIVKIMGQLRCY